MLSRPFLIGVVLCTESCSLDDGRFQVDGAGSGGADPELAGGAGAGAGGASGPGGTSAGGVGELVDEMSNVVPALAAAIDPFTVGRDSPSGSRFLGGIDEVRVCSRALTSKEVCDAADKVDCGGL